MQGKGKTKVLSLDVQKYVICQKERQNFQNYLWLECANLPLEFIETLRSLAEDVLEESTRRSEGILGP